MILFFKIVNRTLSTPLKVQVQDSLGAPTQGVSVTFTINGNSGYLNSTTVVTNASGFAQNSWTLGNVAGTQTVSVSAAVSGVSTQLSTCYSIK